MTILQSDNRLPDCLYMELEELDPNSGNIELPITLRFDEQEIPFENHSIKFGLKGGELSLKLTNGVLPKNCRNLTGLITLRDFLFYQIVIEVTTNHSNAQPKWWFKLRFGSQVFKGSITKQSLGTLQVQNSSFEIKGTFSITANHLCLTKVDGVDLENLNLSINRRRILNRKIAQKIVESECQPHLSQVVLRYG